MGCSNQFVTEFTSWCNALDDDSSNCWALPYNVFNMTKTIDPNNFTVDAMIIYDILINDSFYKLVDLKIPMDSSYISKLVKEYHPEHSRTVRTRFTKQAEIATELGFRVTSDTLEAGEA